MTELTDLDTLVLEHLTYKLKNATIHLYPFPHFYIRDIFPADFYGQLARAALEAIDYTTSEGRYNGRLFGPPSLTDMEGLRGFLTKQFLRVACSTFSAQIKARYGEQPLAISSDLRFIRDQQGYFIGPHTDARWKLVSLLFYLPITDMYARHGTSFYVPKDPRIVCEGGPHHDFAPFNRIWTAPFLPNSLLGFFKTNKSFHGVEPITSNMQRDVLLWNAYDASIEQTRFEQTAEIASNTDNDATVASAITGD